MFQAPDFSNVTTLDDLRRRTEEAFLLLQQSLSDVQELQIQPRARAPENPRVGLKVYADGANWNPGSGAGEYVWNGTAWKRSAETGEAPTSHTHTQAQITDFAHTHTLANITDAGTAAAAMLGTAPGNVPQLNASGALPAVNGSLLTGLVKYPSVGVLTMSGASQEFTGIPAGVRLLTLIFNAVSLNGTDQIWVQIGPSGGVETIGYEAAAQYLTTTPEIAQTNETSAFNIRTAANTGYFTGIMHIAALNQAAGVWVSSHVGRRYTSSMCIGGGVKTITGDLQRVKILASGSNTFDSGTVSLLVQ